MEEPDFTEGEELLGELERETWADRDAESGRRGRISARSEIAGAGRQLGEVNRGAGREVGLEPALRVVLIAEHGKPDHQLGCERGDPQVHESETSRSDVRLDDLRWNPRTKVRKIERGADVRCVLAEGVGDTEPIL